MYNLKDILIIKNNQKFVVTNKTFYDNQYYYLIMDFNNSNDWLIVKEDNGTLIEELDMDIALQVMESFHKELNNN